MHRFLSATATVLSTLSFVLSGKYHMYHFDKQAENKCYKMLFWVVLEPVLQHKKKQVFIYVSELLSFSELFTHSIPTIFLNFLYY